MVDMTSDRHYYKHSATGIIALITDNVAEVFGDRLERVDGPDGNVTKPSASRKKASDKTSDEENTDA